MQSLKELTLTRYIGEVNADPYKLRQYVGKLPSDLSNELIDTLLLSDDKFTEMVVRDNLRSLLPLCDTPYLLRYGIEYGRLDVIQLALARNPGIFYFYRPRTSPGLSDYFSYNRLLKYLANVAVNDGAYDIADLLIDRIEGDTFVEEYAISMRSAKEPTLALLRDRNVEGLMTNSNVSWAVVVNYIAEHGDIQLLLELEGAYEDDFSPEQVIVKLLRKKKYEVVKDFLETADDEIIDGYSILVPLLRYAPDDLVELAISKVDISDDIVNYTVTALDAGRSRWIPLLLASLREEAKYLYPCVVAATNGSPQEIFIGLITKFYSKASSEKEGKSYLDLFPELVADIIVVGRRQAIEYSLNLWLVDERFPKRPGVLPWKLAIERDDTYLKDLIAPHISFKTTFRRF